MFRSIQDFSRLPREVLLSTATKVPRELALTFDNYLFSQRAEIPLPLKHGNYQHSYKQ